MSMSSKMHVCKKRVIKDGKLAAFEGQLMTEVEAIALGLVKAGGEKPEKGPNVAELKQQAKSLGITVPVKVSAATLKKLVAEALEKAAENAPDAAGTDGGDNAGASEGKDDGAAQEPAEGGDE